MATEVERLVYKMEADFARFEKNFKKANGIADKQMGNIQRSVQRRTASAQNSAEVMAKNINRAIATIGVGVAIREIVNYADVWTNAESQLASAGVATTDLANRQKQLVAIALETRTAYEATASLYARLKRSTSELAISEERLLKVTDTVNKSFVAGGASVSEQQAAIQQLGQALGSGVLQGDELRSLRENAPLLAKAIADEFDTTIGGLKDLGAEGELTAERVLIAIENAGANIDTQFSKTSSTISQATTNLETNFVAYIARLDDASNATENISGFINLVAENIELLGQAAIVATAALSGMAGARGAAAVVDGLKDIKHWSDVAVPAIGRLNAGLSFLGGPVGIAVGALAAGLAIMALNGRKAAASIEEIEASARSLNEDAATIRSELETDTKKLADLYAQIEESMKDQATQAEETARIEIAAIERRMSANKNSLSANRQLYASNLSQARKLREDLQREILDFPAVKAEYDTEYRTRLEKNAPYYGGEVKDPNPLHRLGIGSGRPTVTATGETGLEVTAKIAEQQRLAENSAFYIAQQKASKIQETLAKSVANRNLSEAEERLLSLPSRLSTLDERIKEIQDGYKESILGNPKEDPDGDKILENAQKTIEEINRAYLAATETRIQQIQRELRERLTAIDNEKLAEADAADAKSKARKIAAIETEKLVDAEKEKAAAQQLEIERLLEARDLHEQNNRLALARAAGDLETVKILETEMEILNEVNRLRALGVTNLTQAHEQAEKTVLAQIEATERLAQREMSAALEQKDLEDRLELARAEKDQKKIEVLEQELDLRQRISEYMAIGLDKEAATTKAEKQQSDIKAFEKSISDSQEAFRQAFKNGFKQAIETRDVGDALRSVVADSLTRAWDDALTIISDSLYNVFNSIWSTSFGGGGSNSEAGLLTSFASSLFGGSSGTASSASSSFATTAAVTAGIGAVALGVSSLNRSSGVSSRSVSTPINTTPVSVTYAPVTTNTLNGGNSDQMQELLAMQAKREAEFSKQLPSLVESAYVDAKKSRRI